MRQNIHFELSRLAEGVYAALERPGKGAASNAGIVDIGGTVIVFDSFLTPQAGRELRETAEELTGRPVDYVINSHWHDDHVIGNQAFDAATTVISSEGTRTRAMEKIPERAKVLGERGAKHLSDLEKQAAAETDPAKRAAIELNLSAFREAMASLPMWNPRYPDMTFEGELTFHGGQRKARLFSLGEGHTNADSLLYLPDDGIAFVGDLGFIKGHPWIGDGNAAEWVKRLNTVMDWPLGQVVGGHGPVGAVADLKALRKYLIEVPQMVKDMLARGLTEAEILKLPMPDDYAGWEGTEVLEWNVHILAGHAGQS